MVDFTPADIVIYEDEAILVVNKPYGLRSLQDGYDKTLPHLTTLLEPVYGPLWIVHRLDRDTSGVLTLARSAASHRSLNQQFQNRQVVKIYHALVVGAPGWETRRASQPLRKDGDRQHRTVVDARRGKPAVTDFRRLEQYNGYALVEARPYTGYTHQIRVHLNTLGLSIAADPLYGDGQPVMLSDQPGLPPAARLSRLGLHACSITFAHPLSATQVTFQAPYPADLADTLSLLRCH